MNGREIYWPSGRTLGGSSAINGLIYIRGHRDDYDHWASLGNAGWGYAEVLPYFRKLEHNVRGASEWHGADGPLWASDIRAKHELVEAWIAAAAELDIPAQRRLQRRDAGRCRLLPADDAARLSLLHGGCLSAAGARTRSNLAVETNARALRVVVDGRAARGVVIRQGGRDRTVTRAARGDRRRGRDAVAAAAAAVGHRAAVAPPGLGIPVVHALEGVGENLQDHLQVRTIFRCTKPITTNDTLKSWWRTMAMGARYVLTRTGPMAVGINQGGMFARTDPSHARPDIQFHLATLSSDMAGSPVHTFSGFTMSVCQLRPESRGTRASRSRAIRVAAPALQPHYLSTPRDCATVVAGIRLARRLAATRALAPYVAGEYLPGPQATTDDDLLAFAREKGATIFHPAGTCKMGPAADAQAVVDASLRVHGIGGLRVVDCSVMPTIVSGNTNAPVIMIAEKASDMILRDSR